MKIVPTRKLTFTSSLPRAVFKEELSKFIRPKVKGFWKSLDLKELYEGELYEESFHMILNRGRLSWHIDASFTEKGARTVILATIKPIGHESTILITLTLCFLLPLIFVDAKIFFDFLNGNTQELPLSFNSFIPFLVAIFPYALLRAELERYVHETKVFFNEPLGYPPGFLA